MFELLRFIFVFFLGWMAAVWIYDVRLPVESLQDSIIKKTENIKNSKILGIRIFEKPGGMKDLSLPKELKP